MRRDRCARRYRRSLRACPDAAPTPLITLPLKHTRGRDTAGITLRTDGNAFARRVTAGSHYYYRALPTLVPAWT
ncbi:hypothetical protein [Streptomyces sp. NPDC002788]